MLLVIAAALALSADPAPGVAGMPVQSTLEYSIPVAGEWAYAPGVDGSEATFSDSSGHAQLSIRCTRSTRQIMLTKTTSRASPSLFVWTSSLKKSLPAMYNSATGELSIEIGADDSLLDAIASSRGQIGFSSNGLQALVVPPWAVVARTIEDCRV